MRKRRRIKTQHLTKVHWRRFLITSIIFLSFIIIIGLYWFIFLSNFFQLKNTTITGIENYEHVQTDIDNYFTNKNQKFVPLWLEKLLSQYLKQSIGHKNILLLSTKELSASLITKYPEFAKVEPKLDIRHSNLLVAIAYRDISFLLCRTVSECYFLDNNGVLFAQAPQTSGSLIRAIFINDLTPTLGQTIFKPSDLKILTEIFNNSNQENSPLQIKFIELENKSATTIKIMTTSNWYLLINFTSDLNNVFKIVKELSATELKNKIKQLQYIDCRYLPRVFYR